VEPGKGEKVKIKIKDRAVGTEVSIKIFNLSGEMIKKIAYTVLNTGWNETEWDVKNESGNTVGRGMYFIVVKTGGRSETRKIFVVK
jgi:flagellar hook assembly protein FlgD